MQALSPAVAWFPAAYGQVARVDGIHVQDAGCFSPSALFQPQWLWIWPRRLDTYVLEMSVDGPALKPLLEPVHCARLAPPVSRSEFLSAWFKDPSLVLRDAPDVVALIGAELSVLLTPPAGGLFDVVPIGGIWQVRFSAPVAGWVVWGRQLR